MSTNLAEPVPSGRARWLGGCRWHHALATGALFGLLGMLLLTAAIRWGMPSTIAGPIGDAGWTDRSRAWLSATRFYPAEQHEGQAFSWTSGTARLVIPHLSRSQSYELTLHVSAPRPPGHSAAELAIWIDGSLTGRFQIGSDVTPATVRIPTRRAEGVNVRLDVSDTFAPGGEDRRVLGVMVHNVALSDERGPFRPSMPAIIWIGLAMAATIAGVLWCGVGRRIGLTLAVSVTAGFIFLLYRDAAFLGPFVDRLAYIAGGVALLGAVVGIVRQRWPALAGLPEWGAAAGIAIGAAAIKLAIFIHPLMTVGDGVFQVHRAQYVQGGHYFFTSITPRPFYEFPYAIGLYVAAMPFWTYFSSVLDRLILLRGLTLAADALVGVALYAAARRQWGSRVPALLCAALWPFAQAPMHALGNANLTNAFGQALFSSGMAGVIWIASQPRRSPIALALTGAALTAGFLSHFSTLAIGLPLLGMATLALVAGGQDHVRRAGVWVLALALTAAAISYVVYYSHFTNTYRETIERVSTHERVDEEPVGASIAASPATKLRRWITEGSDDYGRPGIVALVVSIAGMVLLVRQRRREAFTLVLIGWAAVWVGWTALGILTPVQMRAALAGAPIFACLSAYALAALASHSIAGKALATVAVVHIMWEGTRVWLLCLGIGP